MRTVWAESGKARITLILALASLGMVAGRFIAIGDDEVIPDYAEEASHPRDFTMGVERDTTYKGVTLSQLQASPKLWVGLHVRLEMRFNRHESTYAPFYTPFVPENYFPFSGWEASRKLWDRDDRTKDFPFLYIRKRHPELNEVIQAERYQNLILYCKVINDFNNTPWLEVLHLRRGAGPQWTDDKLHHMILGMEAVGEGKYEGGAAHLTAALKMDLPRDGEAAAEKELGRSMFFLKDYAAAIRHLERAMNLSENDAEISVILQAARDQARLAGITVIEPTKPGEPIRRTVANENLPQGSIAAPPGPMSAAPAAAPMATDTKEMDALRKAMAARDAQIADLQKQIASAKSTGGGDTKGMEAELAKMKARQEEMEKSMKSKDQAAAEAMKKAAEMSAKVQELSDAKAKLSADLDKNAKLMAELDKKMKDADPKAMKTMQEQIAKLEKERSALEKDKMKMADDLKAVQVSQKDLTSKVQSLEAEKKALMSKDQGAVVKQLEKSLSDKDRQIADLKNELAMWQKKGAVAAPASGATQTPPARPTGAPKGRRTSEGRVSPDDVDSGPVAPPPPPAPKDEKKGGERPKGRGDGQSYKSNWGDLALSPDDGEVLFTDDLSRVIDGQQPGTASQGRRRSEGRVTPGTSNEPISMK